MLFSIVYCIQLFLHLYSIIAYTQLLELGPLVDTHNVKRRLADRIFLLITAENENKLKILAERVKEEDKHLSMKMNINGDGD